MKKIIIFVVIVVLGVVVVVGLLSRKSQATKPNEVPSSNVSITQPVVSQAPTEISLVISSPVDGSMVTTTSVTVRGKTDSGAEVFVNDQATVADGSGNFGVDINLEDGDNYLVVTAIDASGNAVEKELVITAVL